MRKIYNYIMLAVLALAAVSCIDEIGNTDIPTAETGDEVQFGLSLPDAKTRTVYGDVSGDAFPIYWADGDKVQIFSPQASEGRNNAEYKVTLPSGVANPNYAEDLVKTGSYGVQWGKGYTYTDNNTNTTHTGVHDFYSIYPSGLYDFVMDADDNMWAKGVEISSIQNMDYLSTGLVYAMNNCLMYAYTPKVDMGQVANLKYKPLSTVLWFTLSAAELGDVQGFHIMGITLEANNTTTHIAGSFDINISAENLELDKLSGSNKINAMIYDKSAGQEVAYTLPVGGTISFPMFLAPYDFDINGWKIIINTDQGTYTKTLATESKILTAGQIHKIVLPKLSSTKEWDVSQWMTYIPRNVYLSEVSIPGSWNSLNADFQGTGTDLQTQYDNGVRAFHLDTRWTTSANLSGLGVADKYFKVSDISSSNTYLSVADGAGGRHVRNGNYAWSESLGQMMEKNNTSFEERLKTVVSNVKPDEYMIVFCSFAQGSFNDTAKTGKTWMQAISDACNTINSSSDSSLSGRIYDGNKLTSNTLVGDVLGKVIVIVNCESAVSGETLPENSKCVFVNIPNNLTQAYFPTTGFKSDALYSSTDAIDITMAVSQAQITSSTGSSITEGERGYYPSFTERTNVVKNILDWSKTNYGTDNYSHNKWIYLGLGGSTASRSSSAGDSGTAVDVLTEYSTLINNRISAMLGTEDAPFYPVGIVYMNYTVPESYSETNNGTTTYYSSSETVKNILMLNNKYRLQYDHNKPVDYIPADETIEEEIPDEEI